MKKPLPETRLTHERIGSKVMRDDPMTHETMTQAQPKDAIREARRALNALRLEVIPEIADSVSAKVEAAFASLEADAKRLDWMESDYAEIATDSANISRDVFDGTWYMGDQSNIKSLRNAIDNAMASSPSPSTEEPSR